VMYGSDKKSNIVSSIVGMDIICIFFL